MRTTDFASPRSEPERQVYGAELRESEQRSSVRRQVSPRCSVGWLLLRMSPELRHAARRWVQSTLIDAAIAGQADALHDASRRLVGDAEAEKRVLRQGERELAFAHDRNPDPSLLQPSD